ncbi:DedA family protein [Soehngenia longivitae]|uniref:TVP38/TMEM64 family membrane protein n=1 Tax=Soehngenia longivitae TaxID=2562294 RepID=A0A4Z0D8G9_9FIRM|nr:VTT domain-containing protein [Soehngenia longivitae]TFZ41140.1 DedA family protein [Soehngenia longivitae]
MAKKNNNNLFNYKKIIPAILIIAGIIIYLIFGEEITVDNILNMSPINRAVASIFILILYLIKSVSIVGPIMALYIASGLIFPLYLAIPLNILGVAIGLTYSYRIGYSSGDFLKEKILSRYEKLNEFYSVVKDNEWFSAFIIRIVGILPHDIVNMFFGSLRISYYKYMTASIIGLMPMLIISTVIGRTITDPTSPEFLLAIIMRVVLSIGAALIYRAILNKAKKSTKEDKIE